MSNAMTQHITELERHLVKKQLEAMKQTAEEHDEALEVALAMQKYGGSFVQALGNAILEADPINTRKIKAAFPEYWNKAKEQYKRYKK